SQDQGPAVAQALEEFTEWGECPPAQPLLIGPLFRSPRRRRHRWHGLQDWGGGPPPAVGTRAAGHHVEAHARPPRGPGQGIRPAAQGLIRRNNALVAAAGEDHSFAVCPDVVEEVVQKLALTDSRVAVYEDLHGLAIADSGICFPQRLQGGPASHEAWW